MGQVIQMARAQDAIPVVQTATDRDARYPTPNDDQRVFNKATGAVERYSVAAQAWVVDFDASARNARINVMDPRYGAVGDGVTDDRAAILRAITAALSANAEIFFPAGTYYVSTPIALTNIEFLVFRGTPMSRLRAPLRTIPTVPGGTAEASGGVFTFSGCSDVYLTDLVFDGSSDLGTYAANGGQPFTPFNVDATQVQALVEFRACSRVRLRRVVWRKCVPAIPVAGSGGTPNADLWETFNQGVAFWNACDDVQIQSCRVDTPSYGEGLCFSQCTRLDIDRLATTAGYDSSAAYGMSSALNIQGVLTQYVRITNGFFSRHRGSAINLGGLGDFLVQGNRVYYGEGIDCSIENTVQIIADHPPTNRIQIVDNVIIDAINQAGSHGILVGGLTDGSEAFRSIVVARNVIDGATIGISVAGANDVRVEENTLRRVMQYSVASNYGDACIVESSTGVVVANNLVDGSDVVHGGNPVGDKRLIYGVFVQDCEDVTIADNVVKDAAQSNIYAAVSDAWDLPFTSGTAALVQGAVLQSQTGTGQATLIGARVTSGSLAAGTAAGVLRVSGKTGTFSASESIKIGATLNVASVTGDATLISRMRHFALHDNQSVAGTLGTAFPVVLADGAVNTFAGKANTYNNLHNGAAV